MNQLTDTDTVLTHQVLSLIPIPMLVIFCIFLLFNSMHINSS